MFVTKKRMLLALYRIEEQQQEILRRVDKLEKNPETLRDREPDKWMQEGISNILSYQAGQKRGDTE